MTNTVHWQVRADISLSVAASITAVTPGRTKEAATTWKQQKLNKSRSFLTSNQPVIS